MKNSNDSIGNRTRDLPTCSAVPQPNAPPRAPGAGTVIVVAVFCAWSGLLWSFLYRVSQLCQYGTTGVYVRIESVLVRCVQEEQLFYVAGRMQTHGYAAFNKIFSGQQRRHVVGWRVNRLFEDHLRVRNQEIELTQLTDDKAIQSTDAAASRRILCYIQPS